MMRKLVIFLAASMLIIMPMSANALGFDNIKLHSALNEPLDADINLLSATENDIANMKIRLASPEAFMRAGVDRNALLNELKFEVKQKENGQYYIHVTTRIPVREPFINFLLEMEWQNGRMLREYTMLLDPPGLIKKQPAPLQAPATIPAATVKALEAREPAVTPFVEAPAAEPAPVVTAEEEVPAAVPYREETAPAAAEPALPEAAEPLPEVAPVAAEIPEPVEEAPAPAAAPAEAIAEAPGGTFYDDSELFPTIPLTPYREEGEIPAGEMAAAEPAAVEETGMAEGELDYGIVKKGDNLWTIAEKLRPNESISIYQVMMALLASNPDAFVEGNVNRLKEGHVLRIDDPDMLTSISKEDAMRNYQVQTQAWEEYRQSIASSTPEQPIVGSEFEAEETAPVEASGELTLASPDSTELTQGVGTEEAVDSEITTLQEELRQVREDAQKMQGEKTELNEKLEELETEVTEMQRSISVQDDELAVLQEELAKPEAAPIEEAPAEEMAATEAAPAEPAQAEVPEEVVTEVEETTIETPDGEITEEQVVSEDVTAEKSPVELAEEIAQREQQQAPPPVTPEAPSEEGGKGVLDSIMGVLTSIGGGSLLLFILLPIALVLIVLLFIMRKRNQATEAYQESILTGAATPEEGSELPAGKAEAEEESSFLSDFAVSGAGAIQTEDSEVDPLTEADVFMAYGRYEAAEERLKEAIDNDPSRAELKMKLLELYHVTKNKPAFENTAEEFYASLGDEATENPDWQKVAGMGADLLPGNPLFVGSPPEPAPEPVEDLNDESSPSLTESQVMDIGLDTGVFDAIDLGTEQPDTTKPEPSSDSASSPLDIDSGVMEFNLDDNEPSSTPAEKEQEAESGLDFNLDMEPSAAPASEKPAEEPSGLDFNLDMGTESTEQDVEAKTDTTDESSLDFNLDMEMPASKGSEEESGLDFNLESAVDLSQEDTSQDIEAETVGEESKTLDFGLELDTSSDLSAEMTLDDVEMREEVTETQAPAENKSEESSMIDLGGNVDFDAVTEANKDGPAIDPASLTLDIGSELDLSSANTPEPQVDFDVDATDAGDLDIGGGDEVGTKLDLAKAYIDMGDPEGARSILDEVLDEGNEAQKSEAQQLIQQIA